MRDDGLPRLLRRAGVVPSRNERLAGLRRRWWVLSGVQPGQHLSRWNVLGPGLYEPHLPDGLLPNRSLSGTERHFVRYRGVDVHDMPAQSDVYVVRHLSLITRSRCAAPRGRL